jgi:hypothetical protein
MVPSLAAHRTIDLPRVVGMPIRIVRIFGG